MKILDYVKDASSVINYQIIKSNAKKFNKKIV